MTNPSQMPSTESLAAAEKAPLISIRNLTVNYTDDRPPALVDLSLDIADGEFVCILGPSGCGKSTMMHVLARLLPPAAGTVTVGGVPLAALERDSRQRVGYVFQEHRLLPWRRVGDNIRVALKAAGVPKDAWEERVDRYLTMLQMGDYKGAWPLQLSGGQRNRVGIARALAIEPTFILMDEPFSTLDEMTARTLREELLTVSGETGRTVIFVTHSIREAVYLGDRVVLLTRGPGRVLDDLRVDLPHPREYESPALTAIEQRVVERAMSSWGLP